MCFSLAFCRHLVVDDDDKDQQDFWHLSFPSPPHNICGGDEGQIPPFMSAAAGSRWSKSYQGIVPRRNF